ncbi:MAG: DUF1186 domain-containing protein [Clostridiales bacterium]|nr:DUF1186 domain-containing protein [Clostridiales bacterium]
MAIQENINKILEAVEEIPTEAIEICLNYKSESIPHLLKIVDQVFEDGYFEQYEGSFGPVLSVLMLAELKEKELFSRLVKLFDCDLELLEVVFGDFYEVLFPVALGSVCEDVLLLDAIIDDEEQSELAIASAIQAYLTMLQRGVIDRELCLKKFKKLYERDDMSPFTMGVATACVLNIHPRSIESHIRNAYKNESINEEMIPVELVDRVLKQKKDKIMKRFKEDKRFMPITDSIGYFSAYMNNSEE